LEISIVLISGLGSIPLDNVLVFDDLIHSKTII